MSKLTPVAFADIGKSPKTLFDPKAFPSDAKVSFAGSTLNGVSFTASAIQKGSKVEPSIKAAYATNAYALDAVYESADKVTVTGTLKDLAPNLKVVGSVVLPAYQDSAKVTTEYSFPHLHMKAILALTSAPTIEVAAATGYGNLVLGAEAGYNSAKSEVSKYTFAAGYHALDHQLAATLSDKGQTLKLAYAHAISPLQTVGAEVVRKVSGGDTSFALGYHRKLDLLGASSTKFRLDNLGALNIAYETKLSGGEKVVGSVQLNTTDLDKPPKYGFALDLF